MVPEAGNVGSSSKRRAGLAECSMAVFLVILAGILSPAWAQIVKNSKQNLDNLIFVRPELRVSQTLTEAEAISNKLANISDMDRFRSENGPEWHFLMDERTGRVNLAEGGAIPFIPGPANDLKWEDFADASCHSPRCLPLSKIEGLARSFLLKYESIFKVPQDELVLDPVGSVSVGDSIYFLRFQWVHGGVPVEGASIYLAINNGNLIQVGALKMGPISLDPVPEISLETAWQILGDFVGGMDKDDLVVNKGNLVIMPITPRGMDPEAFNVGFGKMIDYDLVYKLAFRRPGVMGTWEALVDAHTGEIIRFVDSNDYGHVQGGVYKTDKPQTEVTMPFPYADYGASSFCDAAGNYTGTSGTSTMNGRTGSTGNVGGVYITDTCGAISQAADANGLIDFGTSTGTDCTTPGHGGAGNTHAARTQYWNVTEIKMKAYSYLPNNSWLQGHLQDNVNLNQTCNAYWDGTKLNFFHSGGGCNNTGELPGVSLHEWGHGMDSNDGSGTGTDNIPVETRADWTALLQTHQSCTGSGFLGSNCSGYGDACTSCTGVRDADSAKHTNTTPWTPQNNGATGLYSCSSGSYNGPCGWEDHCESGIATQALWDFATRDLVGAPTSLDSVTAWQVADRLFYTSMPQAVSMYTCTGSGTKTSNGCGAGSIYTTYRAVDDTGDGVANGTPHAAAIFAALNRHGIACGASTDAANQNETSCPTLSTPTASGTPSNNQVALSWTTGGANATRYFVFRNETGCSAGFTRIATVAAPTLAYTDTACFNGVTYYYRVQAAAASDACTSPMSSCITEVPTACTTPGTPTIGTLTLPGNNQIRIPWTAGSPTGSTYNIYRSNGACPGGAFAQIVTGLTTSPYTDGTVSGGTTYSYKVTAVDSTGGCESTQSSCASATATGTCTAAPTFAGITSVTNPQNTTCTLSLAWSAGTSNCSGTVTYNVYRNTAAPFTPAAGNRIASGVTATSYGDANNLTSGTTYYYIVRAVDSANSSEDTNTVTMSGAPTGPITTATLTDTFEGALSGGGFDLAGWTHSAINGTTNWAWSTAQHHDGTHSWFAQDIAAVSDMVLVSPSFGVGASTTLSFYHTYAFESGYDGGTLEYTTNGGTTWTMIPTADYTAGAPSTTIPTTYSNPIGGETAWSGGTVGTMTQVSVNLGGDANILNKTVQIRWHEGNDSSVASTGWYVDTVVIANAQTMGSCTTGSGCTAPGAPTLNSAAGDCNGVNLAWTAGSGSTSSYNVYRSTNTSCPVGTLTKIAGPIITTSYSDTSAVAGTTYTYVVRGACDAAGTVESANSNCLAGTRSSTPAAPAAPGVADISACAQSGVTLTWGSVTGATSYDLYVDATTTVTGVTSPYTYNPGNTSSHNYQVRANNTCGSSAWSTATAGTDANGGLSAPAAPGVADISACAMSGVTITWSAVTGATGYDLQVDGGTITPSVTSPYTYSPGDTSSHTYAVRAKSATCTSAFSSTTSGTDANSGLAAPAAPTVSDVDPCAQSGVNITWGAVTGATGYDLQVDGGTITTGVTSPYAYNPGNSNSHTYAIRAKNTTCTSAFSSTTSGTDAAGGLAAPAAPTVTDLDPCAQSGVSISWNSITGATGYDLQVDGATVTTGVTSPYTYNPGNTSSHTYAIRGKNATCTSAFSSATAATDAAQAPPSVGTLTITKSGNDMIISWVQLADPSLVDYYEVMRSLSPSGPFDTSVGTATGIVHGLDLNLANEPATAYYEVRAVKGSCPGPLN